MSANRLEPAFGAALNDRLPYGRELATTGGAREAPTAAACIAPAMLLFLMFLLAPIMGLAAEVPAVGSPAIGSLENVAELSINPGNLSVTADGRVYATVHQLRPADARLIEITGRDSYRPWPNREWNAAFGSGPDVMNAPLGIQLDRKNRLWVIDNGLGPESQPPKLIAFSLETGEVVFRHDFSAETGPVGSFLNDLAVDAQRGFVYLADGSLETLVQDDRLLWPDALSFGEPGWLYIAVNQLHRAPPLNGGVEAAELPFRVMRVYTGNEGVPGR